jgi:hypothetical protein
MSVQVLAPHVDDDGEPGQRVRHPRDQLGERTEHLRRQVVHHVPAVVFQRMRRRGAACTGHARDHQQFGFFRFHRREILFLRH